MVLCYFTLYHCPGPPRHSAEKRQADVYLFFMSAHADCCFYDWLGPPFLIQPRESEPARKTVTASDQTRGFGIRMQVPQSCGFMRHSSRRGDRRDLVAVNIACELADSHSETTVECLIVIDARETLHVTAPHQPSRGHFCGLCAEERGLTVFFFLDVVNFLFTQMETLNV